MIRGIVNQLVHNTFRLEAKKSDGGTSYGTGFAMDLRVDDKGHISPVIITNKHVIANANEIELHVSLHNGDGNPILGEHRKAKFKLQSGGMVLHPDDNVDLVALAIPFYNFVFPDGLRPFYIPVTPDLIPTEDELETYSPMEDITMIGYPNGIWDMVHNMPVIRRGVTATHSKLALNSKPEFLTDMASFPGSSGSPVYLLNTGSYLDQDNNIVMGNRVKLLGVHYAGALHTASGRIEIVRAPTSTTPVPITQVPNHIGVAIQSREILVIEEELKKRVSSY
ncbi:S1 family peptidase [Salinicola halophyticus]|uniref:S1 family peptidase n=1 Tax=Salinicola halophyticus TaxID=1808881 RepID=UPI003F476789